MRVSGIVYLALPVDIEIPNDAISTDPDDDREEATDEEVLVFSMENPSEVFIRTEVYKALEKYFEPYLPEEEGGRPIPVMVDEFSPDYDEDELL